MTSTYHLFYDDAALAYIQITYTDTSRAAIKEMVEFWSNWEYRLASAKGDYTQCFLRQLAFALLRGGPEAVTDREGWCPLDGSYDIKLLGYWPPEWNEDLISIEEGGS